MASLHLLRLCENAHLEAVSWRQVLLNESAVESNQILGVFNDIISHCTAQISEKIQDLPQQTDVHTRFVRSSA